jgi:hypothetical protein
VKAIKDAVKRGVYVTFISRMMDAYNRDDAMKLLAEFREIGCSVFLLANLHAKIYYTESLALVTSMNLYLASTIQNHEIGVMISDAANLDRIRQYLGELVSLNEAKSISGKRVVKATKVPSGMKTVAFKVVKKGRGYYHVRIDGKYPSRVAFGDVGSVDLAPGKIYTCTANVQWRTTKTGRKKSFMTGISGISPAP